ncbi:MAG: LapA family protein [Thiomicrospira sp.]|jgi:putative membrane protein|nr:LapA family protein [Thiomicrospira sp.]
MLKLLSLIAIFVFLVVGVLIGLLNPILVEVDYYFARLQLPLSIVISLSFALGLLLAGLVSMMQITRLHWRLNRVNKQTKAQASEILELKKNLHTLESKAEQAHSLTALNVVKSTQ